MFNIRFRKNILQCSPQNPLLMGVLNVTPDSFSDGGKYYRPDMAVERGMKMEEEGAGIIDIGGESSRPGASPVSEDEEKRRVITVIERLVSKLTIPISVDTCKAGVARLALEAGASMVNDITALRGDPDMSEVLRESDVPVCMMHMQGSPKDMQKEPCYYDILSQIHAFFKERISFAASRGISETRIILDPGIGFGKTLEHNTALIRDLDRFSDLGRPILLGPSRKSFIGKILDLPENERIEGTIASCLCGLARGASILRVHDVLNIKRALRVWGAIINQDGFIRCMN